LLRKKVPVNYLGRDIGANLKRLYNKLSNHGQLSLDSTIANAQIEMNKDPDKADKYDSLIAILEAHDNVDSALKFLTEARTNAISLATGHKAKGLEWQRVYHLNPWMIPSKYVQEMEPEDGAESPAYEKALRQENNLRYVIETRTKDELFLVNQDSLR
jgi:superfamily I DNA/RNA helicase